MPRDKETSREKLGCLQIDGKEEFISIRLKSFCDENIITIGYTSLYIYEENRIAEQYLRTLVIIKDSLLIDSGLPINFSVDRMNRYSKVPL